MSASRSGVVTTHVGDGFVPVIDFSPLHSGTTKDKQDLAKQIDAACRTVGFYVMTGHGVSAELLTRLEREARAFFDLPLEEKMKLHVGTAATTVGYAAIGDRALAYIRGRKSPPDLNEAFSIAKTDIDPNDSYYQTALAKSLIPENRWPDNRPEFKRALTEYYKVAADLARELMGLSAIALGVPKNYFDDKIDHHISRLHLRLYPEQKEKPLPGQLRAGEHTDYGTVTILRPGDTVGGLQVIDKDGAWHDVPTVPDSFVINHGDLMARWTNDHWISNLHRVINPPEEAKGGSRRLSIVFFQIPNHDAMVEPLSTCRGPGEPEKYPPIQVSDFYRMRREQQRGAA
jgi:isopenicillin N synthase-like dioxygenase